MKKWKRNIVLKILICTVLVFILFFVYMTKAKNNTSIEIEDISGDRAYLEPFSFQGIASASFGTTHFAWENGELHTRYYPINHVEMETLLQNEEKGNTGFLKYFGQHYDTNPTVRGEVCSLPSETANRSTITDMNDLTEKNQKILKEKIDSIRPDAIDLKMSGFTTKEIKVYGEVTDHESKYARFFTGLTLSDEEFYFTKWEDENNSFYEDSDLGVHLLTAEVNDAIYTVLATNEACNGEVFLLRIPKERMGKKWSSDTECKSKEEGEAQVLRTFAVNQNQRMIGLIKVNEERLLLARSEHDHLILELYDTNGNLITQKDTGVEEFSKYEVNSVYMLHEGVETVVWFALPQRIEDVETEDNVNHYAVEDACYYVCGMEEIKELPIEEYPDYVDYENGTVLSVAYNTKSNMSELQNLLGIKKCAYSLKVQDINTGNVLYKGILTSDFEKDYLKMLSKANIGKKAGTLDKRKKSLDIWQNEWNGIRSFRSLLPLHGNMEYTDWMSGYTVWSKEF